ncbi:MAG TPA: hypothetical protein VFC21_01080 [Bryobacteraceae bacterium]|nr:hypothetical protein [Bryobacteraceae bacterium]
MQQALHIFRKDIRYLRFQIGLFFVLAAVVTALQSSPVGTTVELLVILGAINLTVRLIHAETIAGTTQFWITRPYRWRSLFAAKLLFLALFVNLPLAIARFIALLMRGYPLLSSLPALIWSHILTFGATLLIAAVATLTTGLIEFSFVLLAIAIATVIVELGPMMIRIPIWPTSVEWIQTSAICIVLVAVAAAVLLWQYRDRCTDFSRRFALIAGAAVAVLYFALPLPAGLAIQSWFSHGPAPPVLLTVESGRPDRIPRDSPFAIVPVSIRIGGIRPGEEIRPDAFNVRLDWPAGKRWQGAVALSAGAVENGTSILTGTAFLPREFIAVIGAAPATLHGILYLTSFGDPESRRIPFASHPVDAQSGMQCFDNFHGSFKGAAESHSYSTYFCRAFFGWPSRLVTVTAQGDIEDFTKIISYSPFPASAELHSEEARYTTFGLPPSGRLSEVTITTKKPLAHFHREVEASGIRFAN